jgi:hypothetical protein
MSAERNQRNLEYVLQLVADADNHMKQAVEFERDGSHLAYAQFGVALSVEAEADECIRLAAIVESGGSLKPYPPREKR